jgi:hypothetical protein
LIALIAENTSELYDADVVRGGTKLQERTITPHSHPGSLERLTQKERTRRRRSSGEGNEIVSGKTASSHRSAASGEITARSV